MKTGIYKITNRVNNMVYIGQSVDIDKRWNRHRQVYDNPNAHEYNYYIYRAMRKYGIENFDFEILEECQKDELNEREKYWISYYNSYYDGYNQTPGGDGSSHPVKISPQTLDEIDQLLINSDLTIQEIADKIAVSYEMIQGINTGRYWKRDKEYPIRNWRYVNRYRKMSNNEFNNMNKQINYCIDCGKIIHTNSKRCKECSQKSQMKCDRPDKMSLLKLIAKNSITSVGAMFGVSDNAVRKWCKTYGIPHRKPEIIQYIKHNDIILE